LLARQFNTTSVLFARKERKIPIPTKKQLAAKARKKALKVKKHIYDSEKMPLQDAIAVLRVRRYSGRRADRYSRTPQAVEVGRPHATIELVVKTAMPKGTTIPKGRLTWPREAKPQSEERILVFAEGRQADEAKRAGAHTVGGLELVDDVGAELASFVSVSRGSFLDYQWTLQSDYHPLRTEPPSFDHSETRSSARSERSYAFGEARNRDRRH